VVDDRVGEGRPGVIPAAFDYRRASSVDDALAAIAGGDAKVLAGGMSLLPLMKLRLANPGALVDIGGLAELKACGATPDGGYEVGALATYADVLDAAPIGISRECISQIGDVQVRNRGTIGGALSHADPASDLPALALALDYRFVLRSSRGERTVDADGFFTGAFTTVMAPDELFIKGVRGPLPAGAGGSYQKLENPASGYSIVGVAAVIATAGGSVTHARVALTGVGEVAYRAKAVEAALLGSDGSAAAVAAAAQHATEGQTVNSDIHAGRDYRARMAVVYTRRAIEAALGR
jgi:carbon-monoxide dehydrogenase medium subunit